MRAVEKRLRERVKSLETELAEVTKDRDAFRTDFVYLIKESLRIHGTAKSWSMIYLIEWAAKSMAAKKYWYW